MRFLAPLSVIFAAAGCTEPPTWGHVGRTGLLLGANVLATATGGTRSGNAQFC
jgi:hypothetical protein